VIPGFFDPERSRPAPMVRVDVLMSPATNSWLTVDFLLDTGAGRTCLHPRDSLRSGLSEATLAEPGNWPHHQRMSGVGGSTLYYVTRTVYSFATDSGESEVIEGQILIAQPRPDNAGLPSLLGWDMLYRFEVLVDWRSRRVELR